jgi:hypothetical protein
MDTSFAEAQNLLRINTSTELQTEGRDVAASWYM